MSTASSIKVIFGESKDPIEIGKKLLPPKSLLKALSHCQHCDIEHQKPHIVQIKLTAAGFNVDALDVYLGWLHQQKIQMPDDLSLVFNNWGHIFLLWLVGQDIRDTKFQNYIMDRLLELRESHLIRWPSSDPFPRHEEISFVYEHTSKDCPLRRYLVDFIADYSPHHLQLSIDISSLTKEYGEFLSELSEKVAGLRGLGDFARSLRRAGCDYTVSSVNPRQPPEVLEILAPAVQIGQMVEMN